MFSKIVCKGKRREEYVDRRGCNIYPRTFFLSDELYIHHIVLHTYSFERRLFSRFGQPSSALVPWATSGKVFHLNTLLRGGLEAC